MGNQKEDQILEDYLNGNSPLSKSYSKESAEEPPAHLDAAIVLAAKKAVKPDNNIIRPAISRWYVPLSLAAVVVITFSVVFKIYDEGTLPARNKHVEILTEKPADMKDSNRKDSGQELGAGKTAGEKRYRGQDMEVEEDSDVPASMSKSLPQLPAEAVIMEDAVKNEMSKDAIKGTQNRMLESPATSDEMKNVPALDIISTETAGSEISSQKSDDISREEITGGLDQQQWIELINKLWEEGNKEGAKTELEKFIDAHPEITLQQLRNQLPMDMDLSGIIK